MSTIVGTAGSDTLIGTIAGDRIEGLAGSDSISGNEGNDTLLGGGGNDRLDGGIGDYDWLTGGLGNDTLDGGASSESTYSVDTAIYQGSAPVSANLQLGTATQGGFADTLVRIDAVFSGGGADSLRGADGPAALRGETLRGGAGNDTIDGGSGVDSAEFVSPCSGYTVTRVSATTWTVRDNDTTNGDEGTDTLVNIERIVFADRMLSFGARAEELARVAFVLWTKDIVGSGALFSRGLSFYDVGYDFVTMSTVALQFWTGDTDTELAQRLIANSGSTKSVAQLLATMAANGGSVEGRAAALREIALDSATTLLIEQSGIRTDGLVSNHFVPGFGTLFDLLPGAPEIVEEPLATLDIDDPTASEGDPGGTNATITFTITRSGDVGGESAVAYAVTPGTASSPGDYNATLAALAGTVSFAPGETSKQITLDITDDTVAEGTETFTVTLSGPIDAQLGKATGTGTIIDDDLLKGIVWANGGSVVLGSALTPTRLSVGTNAATPAGKVWTGAAALDNWSAAGNWSPAVAPAVADTVVFAGAGGIDIVDTALQVASLHYSGAATHHTDFGNANTLSVSGEAAVHVANPSLTGTLAIVDRTSVVAHLTEWNVGLNEARSGTATGFLYIGDLASVDAADVDVLSIGRETGTASGHASAATGSLKLASNSSITLGSATAPATLNIGWSQNANFSTSGGSASGVLDALDRAAVLDLHLSELNVGRGSIVGVGSGTLKWNQSEVITAPIVTFGRGYATGALEVPTGGQFLLGTAEAPITTLRIAYNDAGRGTASAALDFSQTNPTFSAFIASELSIGRETGTASGHASAATGSLKLASNSSITLGSATAPATLNIGWSQNANLSSSGGSASGLLDASAGTFTATLTTLTVGVTSSKGSSNGQLLLGQDSTITATTANIGTGTNATGTVHFPDAFGNSFNAITINLSAGQFDFAANTLEIGGSGAIRAQTFNMRGGLLSGHTVDLEAGGTFTFTGGRLAVDTFNGTLNQSGGRLAPGNTGTGSTTVNGAYNLAAAGTLEIQLTSLASDRLIVNGVVDLNGTGTIGGALDVQLGYTPLLNDSFVIVQNDGVDAILASFAGLADGATFTKSFGGQVFTFTIDYQGGDGNDVAIQVTQITVVSAAQAASAEGRGGDTESLDSAAAAAAVTAGIELVGVASDQDAALPLSS